MKKTVAIVQARINSTRLPGKVLLPLAGRQVLFHIWERLSQITNIDEVVIATTDNGSDIPIVKFCHDHNINVFAYNGQTNNLLGRYIACGQHYGADIIVMVDGDCPLLHPPTITRMVEALLADPEADYCKLDERSIEGGVAVLRLDTYLKMEKLVTENCHREHATMFLVENPHLFSIVHIPCEDEFRDIKHRLWLDTPADYRFLSTVYEQLYQPDKIVDLHQVVHWLRTDEALRSINAHVTQKDVRERGRPLVVILEDLNHEYQQQARKIIADLTEEFHAGVRVLSSNLSSSEQEWWTQQGVTISPYPPQVGEGILTIDASQQGFIPLKPAPGGEPQMKIGLLSQASNHDLAVWSACYGGYQKSQSGYLTATQRSSEDGSHLEILPCPLCGSQNLKNVWTHSSGITNGICLDCGHVYLTRQLSEIAIDMSYRDYQQSYPDSYLNDPSNGFFELARNRHQLLAQYLPKLPTSLLEIGCGYGHFLQLAEPTCFRVGIEPSHEQVLFARQYFKIDEIWECSYKHLPGIVPTWSNDGFDLVCSFHVLEHIKQPTDFLKFIKKLLKPDGYLCLAVPNLLTLSPDLIELFFSYRNWHLHIFSAETLSRLLEQAGFEVVILLEEAPIPMLRSSLLVIARSREFLLTSSQPDVNTIQVAEQALARFHNCLNQRLKNVKCAFYEWKTLNKKIAIYGGGIHTKALLELSDIPVNQVHVIIDDDLSKQGQTLQGIPIYNFVQAVHLGIDVIVVSSLASEHRILDRLEQTAPKNISIFGIYRDLMRD